MAIVDAIKEMKRLKDTGVIRDYLIFGSVAAMVHTRPFSTADIDIGVQVGSDDEYLIALRSLTAAGRTEGHSVVIHGTPVEMFPVEISPIIQDALTHARRKLVEGIMVKVASPEHLVLEALRVNRPQDKARVLMLAEAVESRSLNALFRRLDRDGTLKRRYESLTNAAP